MENIKQLKSQIEQLDDEEYSRLRKWFAEQDWKRWDQQIEEDAENGKLTFLKEEAKQQQEEGDLKEL